MKAQSIWISYDLGIKGDYPGLYRFLDINKAKECGNSIAYFKFKYEKDLALELENEIKKNVDIKNGDRIYVIFLIKSENDEFKTAGSFIIGNRKASPWEGYAPQDENNVDM
jgi:hypothetical protein